MPLFTDQDFCHFLQDTAPAPLARTISYNIAGPISALGSQSPTLAQLMSRYATMDPTLISSASDKRKAPSLVAPSAVKKKRTYKRLLIQVRTYIKSFFILIIFYLVQFQTRTQQPLVITESANSSSTGKIFIISFYQSFSSLALILYLLVAEETLVSQTVESSSPQHVSNPTSPSIQPSSLQAEASASPRMDPASPQPEASALPRTPPASPQLETSALPRTPQAPIKLDIQEPFLEPEKLSSPTQEARNDVSMNTHLSILFIQ
jgi:hypothetical protein